MNHLTTLLKAFDEIGFSYVRKDSEGATYIFLCNKSLISYFDNEPLEKLFGLKFFEFDENGNWASY